MVTVHHWKQITNPAASPACLPFHYTRDWREWQWIMIWQVFFFLLVKTFILIHVLLSFCRRIAFPLSPTVVCECEMLLIKLHPHGVYWVALGSVQKSLELGWGWVVLEWHCAPSTLSHESPQRECCEDREENKFRNSAWRRLLVW